MDIFGSFTFGRLIKTFLPGFVIFLSLCTYVDIFFYNFFDATYLYNFAKSDSALFVAFSIPFSIILGVLSNTLFFTYFTRALITKNHYKHFPEFYDFQKKVFDIVKCRVADTLRIDDPSKDRFDKSIDVESFLLSKTDVDKVIYASECFWYYLEFQLNILWAFSFMLPAVITVWIMFALKKNMTPSVILMFSALIIVIFTLTCRMLLISARKNFYFHKKQYLSLLLGSYLSEKK